MTAAPKTFIPRFLPGEEIAVEEVKRLGAIYGFGNLISHLKSAWSDMMVEKYDFDRQAADYAGQHICAWCDVDGRTGKKVKRPKVKKRMPRGSK